MAVMTRDQISERKGEERDLNEFAENAINVNYICPILLCTYAVADAVTSAKLNGMQIIHSDDDDMI